MVSQKAQKHEGRYCAGTNLAGNPCRRTVAIGHAYCPYHLGQAKKRIGAKPGPNPNNARPGNDHAMTHGIYTTTYTEEELGMLPELAVDSLDDEIRVAKIQLRRALVVQRAIAEAPMDTTNMAGFQLAEVQQDRRTSRVDRTEDGRTVTHATQHDSSRLLRRRIDCDQIIDRLLSRLTFLAKTRADLVGNLSGAQSAAEIAREVADHLAAMEASVAGGAQDATGDDEGAAGC